MKYLFFVLILLIAGSAGAQRVRVENRAGKVVIIRTKTTQTGEKYELSEWRADPLQVLQNELVQVEKQLSTTEAQIERLQAEEKEKTQTRKDLEKAIADLSKNVVIETGIPGKTTKAPKAKTKAAKPAETPPAKKATPKKPRQ